jgi:hypothetical protein
MGKPYPLLQMTLPVLGAELLAARTEMLADFAQTGRPSLPHDENG